MNTARNTATALFLLGLFLTDGCVTQPAPTPKDQTVAIEDVISQVQQALADVQTALAAKHFPPVKEVRLTLQTVATEKLGGTVKLWVVSLGSTAEKSKTQQITLTLVPPPPRKTLALELSLSADLEAAILSAAEGVEKATTGPVPLTPSALDVEINFTVKTGGSGGANVRIAPVTVGMSGDVAASSVQTVKVSFAVKQ